MRRQYESTALGRGGVLEKYTRSNIITEKCIRLDNIEKNTRPDSTRSNIDHARCRKQKENISSRLIPHAYCIYRSWELLSIIITLMIRSANFRVCDTCCEDFCYGRCEAFQYQDSQVPPNILTIIMSDDQTR